MLWLLAALSLTLGSFGEEFDTRDMPEACKNLKPVHSNYTPMGITRKIGDLDIYEAPNASNERKKMLISVYDIFGIHPNAQQVVDRLSEGGFRVVMPDFFRGAPWDINNFPPPDRKELLEFINKNGSWENVCKSDLERVIDHYKTNEGVTQFGIFGFCWGGKIASLAASELNEIKVSALVHPSLLKPVDAYKVKSPTFLMPSKDEPDMIPFLNILKKNLGDDNAKHIRFDDMSHGFAGARGNFSNPLNVKRVNEVIYNIVKFADEQFRKSPPNKEE